MPLNLEILLALSVGPDSIFSTAIFIICCLVALIVLFIEKSTGSSALLEYDDEDDDDAVVVAVDVVIEVAVVVEEVEKEVGFAPNDEVKFVEILLEHLHMFIPDGLLFDFSEKASSITLSRVSWGREIYGTTPSFACCEVDSLLLILFVCIELFVVFVV